MVQHKCFWQIQIKSTVLLRVLDLPFMLYHIVSIGRQRLIKNWNEGNMVIMSVSVHWNAWAVEQFKVQILGERQFLHLMVLFQPKTRNQFQFFILNYQNTRIRAFRWRLRGVITRLFVIRESPSHIRLFCFLCSLLTDVSLLSSFLIMNESFDADLVYLCCYIFIRWTM